MVYLWMEPIRPLEMQYLMAAPRLLVFFLLDACNIQSLLNNLNNKLIHIRSYIGAFFSIPTLAFHQLTFTSQSGKRQLFGSFGSIFMKGKVAAPSAGVAFRTGRPQLVRKLFSVG